MVLEESGHNNGFAFNCDRPLTADVDVDKSHSPRPAIQVKSPCSRRILRFDESPRLDRRRRAGSDCCELVPRLVGANTPPFHFPRKIAIGRYVLGRWILDPRLIAGITLADSSEPP